MTQARYRWHTRPRWLYTEGMLFNVLALSMAFGKEAARRAVLEAEANRTGFWHLCDWLHSEKATVDTAWSAV